MYLRRLKDSLGGKEVQIYPLDQLKGAEDGIYLFLVRVTDTFPRRFPHLKFDQYVKYNITVCGQTGA